MDKIKILEDEFLDVIGAREHNLKNLSIKIPRNQLVVITGLSGSGKSSLAFDTIYAEGQRRYIETFGSYARQFLGSLERPEVDKITGLSPVISIEQKTVNKNPRSTVGTITEIYDFLRLLFARTGEAYSYKTGEKMIQYSDKQIIELILTKFNNKKVLLLSPVIKGRKGHYRELFEQIRKQGFTKVKIDGEIVDITPSMRLDRYKVHDIDIVIDRIQVSVKTKKRIYDSLQTCMKHGKGSIIVQDFETGKTQFFSRSLMCPTTGIAYDAPAPNAFSFNSPYGACSACNGLGTIAEISLKKVIPNPALSIKKGGIAPIGEYKNSWIFNQIDAISKKFNFKLTTPIQNLPEEAINTILFGSEKSFSVELSDDGVTKTYNINFEGVINFVSRQYKEKPSPSLAKWANSFMNKNICSTCNGTRLKTESLFFKIDNKNIAELASMDISDFSFWFTNIESRLTKKQNIIAKEILKEIRNRSSFLLDVGLDYLSLNRSSRTLSGGEAQRIRLATQIGSQLVGVLYILDEPSIGLHQRDNVKLIEALKNLRDIGNSIIVVEHDKEMMEAADYVIDIGPKAGLHGGKIVSHGTYQEILKHDSLTSNYLNGSKEIIIPEKRRKGNGKKLTLKGANGNNLQKVDLEIPLGKFVCITGVSGSGKSTLINSTLYPALCLEYYRSVKKPMAYTKINGLKNLDKVIEIDQSPIGRTPRSNPATYTGVFSEIRELFTHVPEAKIRGYKPGRFSFNVKGGRCETCRGGGIKRIEMNFLPDVYVECETCKGKRYNRETLEVRYKGKSINDVLNMTINQAVDFFGKIPNIINRIKTIQSVGLGYITLGQQSTTLSGGEAQRVKLATELSKRGTGNTMYILDEPTTGLHFEDIRILLEVLNRIVNQGNTVIVIEHNLDIIKVADHVIDLGPDGGRKGGRIIATGTPEQIATNKESITGYFLNIAM